MMMSQIDISNLPQTPSVCHKILALIDKRQGQLAKEWGIDRTTLSRTVSRMRAGKPLTPKTWSRFAEFYLESLKTQRAVENYLNS